MDKDAMMLSESAIDRDPFQQARKQKESKTPNSTVLSNSPISEVAPMAQDNSSNINSLLEALGVSGDSLAMNDMGKVQLIGRLREKFGDNYMENPGAASAVGEFDKQLSFLGNKTQTSMNQGLANANRTLGALFGRNNE